MVIGPVRRRLNSSASVLPGLSSVPERRRVIRRDARVRSGAICGDRTSSATQDNSGNQVQRRIAAPAIHGEFWGSGRAGLIVSYRSSTNPEREAVFFFRFREYDYCSLSVVFPWFRAVFSSNMPRCTGDLYRLRICRYKSSQNCSLLQWFSHSS